MYIYQVNEDGVTCAIQAHRPENAMPDGWIQVPSMWENKSLYVINGMLTDQKPQSLIDEELAEMDAEIKIQAKMRTLAIKELIKDGDLPSNYKDRRIK
jgi:hypothetical protein